jgi:toxin ParE1/3/4
LKLIFTRRATRQIEAIIAYIARESPQGARRVRARLQTVTGLLIEQPYLGHVTDLAGVRRLLVTPFPYVIFYRITEDAVIIQRVRHTSRDPAGM